MTASFGASRSACKHNLLRNNTLREPENFAVFPNEIPFPRKYAILRASGGADFNT